MRLTKFVSQIRRCLASKQSRFSYPSCSCASLND